jgi:hypothetical protein
MITNFDAMLIMQYCNDWFDIFPAEKNKAVLANVMES